MRTVTTTYGRDDIREATLNVSVMDRKGVSYVKVYFHGSKTTFRTANTNLNRCKDFAKALCTHIKSNEFPWTNEDGDRQFFSINVNAPTL